jgi:hypothetical protein
MLNFDVATLLVLECGSKLVVALEKILIKELICGVDNWIKENLPIQKAERGVCCDNWGEITYIDRCLHVDAKHHHAHKLGIINTLVD